MTPKNKKKQTKTKQNKRKKRPSCGALSVERKGLKKKKIKARTSGNGDIFTYGSVLLGRGWGGDLLFSLGVATIVILIVSAHFCSVKSHRQG